jgi:L-seryl-tRNA(Ser) seleniumtransferase
MTGAADRGQLFRLLPAVDALVQRPEVEDLVARYPRGQVVSAARSLLSRWREGILAGAYSVDTLGAAVDAAPVELGGLLEAMNRPSLRRVINATGVILHTNLGRAPLSEAARERVQEVTAGYCALEVDVETGERGHRENHVRRLLQEVTGAEDALVVNNNAAAVLLMLTVVGQGREVVVSRGELVEIGGSFRVPDVMAQSGCRLVEVGTTNKTYAGDYEKAAGENTAAFLKVHTSNYRLIGFTHTVSAAEMAQAAHAQGVLALEDLGSGVLVDLALAGLPHEPTVQESVAAGMDLVCFSGDKMLGGPQAGIVVGKHEMIAKLNSHPLMRALRPGKMTYAALEATLAQYADADSAVRNIPVLAHLFEPLMRIERRARELVDSLTLGSGWRADVLPCAAEVGGGSLPGTELDSFAVRLRGPMSPDTLAARLRQGDMCVMARILHDDVILDMRSIRAGELPLLKQAIEAIGGV